MMEPKQYQLKYDFSDEDMDMMKYLCQSSKGKLAKAPYVKSPTDRIGNGTPYTGMQPKTQGSSLHHR